MHLIETGARWIWVASAFLIWPTSFMAQANVATNPMRLIVPLDKDPWQLSPLPMGEGERRGIPRRLAGSIRTIPVHIPNDVQLTDFVKEPLGQSPDIAKANEQEWWYTRHFATPGGTLGREVRLVFDGVDYFADVWLNGVKLGSHEGAYSRFDFEVGVRLAKTGDNYLAVRVTAPWKVPGRSHYEFMKGEYEEAWDALPGPGQVVFPLGLHRGVHLEVTSRTRVVDLSVSTAALAESAAKLHFAVQIVSNGGAARGIVRTRLVPENFSGEPVALPDQPFAISTATAGVTVNFDTRVMRPKLWWTWDLGAQNLYRAEVSLVDEDGAAIDSTAAIFGIRTVERDSNLLYRINGQPVLMRGAWYAMSRLYPASTDRWTYEKDLRLARNANMNHLVNYTVIEKDDFYDLADRLGVLLFMELPFNQEGPIDALNDSYPRRQQFIDWSAAEVRQIVKQLRNHPSIGVWAPVAEVTENSPEIKVSWDKRIGEAKNGYNLFLSVMQSAVVETDSDALYFRSYCDFGEHHFWEGTFFSGTTYDQQFDASASFVSEYGAEALFAPESVSRIVDIKTLWAARSEAVSPVRLPIDVRSFPYQHPWQSFGVDFTTTAIGLNVTRNIETFDQYVNASQIYQSFIYGYAADAYRRKAFDPINGIRSWMLKSFPEVPIGGFGVIDAFDTPTRAYYEQKRTFAPIVLSFAIRLPLESIPAGSNISVPIWLSNISPDELADVSVTWGLYSLDGKSSQGGQTTAAIAAHHAASVATATFVVPEAGGLYLLRGYAHQGGHMISTASSFLKVATRATRRPLRVLVVGSPEWANPTADFLEGFGAQVSRALAENTVIRPLKFPASVGELRSKYDVIWLAGYNAYWREAPPFLTDLIKSAVSQGTTLVHSGSSGSFHGGGDINNRTAALDLTSLADVLPVTVEHENDVYSPSKFLTGKQRNPFAIDHTFPVVATESAPQWLRQVDFANVVPESFHVLRAKPTANVLLRLGELPLLVSGQYGQGKTIAYMGFSPEGSPAIEHAPVILDRAIREAASGRDFATISAIILALASGDDPPQSIARSIDERAAPIFESILSARADPPERPAVSWSQDTDGTVHGHVRIENGNRFNFELRLRVVQTDGHMDDSLALWSDQFFNLLPHEVAESDITVVRSVRAAPVRMTLAIQTIDGREVQYPDWEVPPPP